jgi:hypothetical protein
MRIGAWSTLYQADVGHGAHLKRVGIGTTPKELSEPIDQLIGGNHK